MINRSGFYKNFRKGFGLKSLSQSKVNGFEAIFNEWDKAGHKDLRWISYALATAWHETAYTMTPLREYGLGKKHKYGKIDPETGFAYYGRGFVQLTWRFNYKAYGIEHDPDRALDPQFAAFILIDGMVKGVFTGRKLSNYFNKKTDDPVEARRIINGKDRAKQIAGHHYKFLAALG